MADWTFARDAKWVWSSKEDRPFNRYVMFRRQVTLKGQVSRAMFRITADSRYELFVNGRWIGHGPARSWPSLWPVDEYDLSGDLQPGDNTIAVMVYHFGIGTFQYVHAEAGLLAQLDYADDSGEKQLLSDASWKAMPNRAYAWPVPRICCQQGWEEQFDANGDAIDASGRRWVESGYDDSAWAMADELGLAGEYGSHPKFELRDIPFLTRRPLLPTRVVSSAAVRPADYSWSLNLLEIINPDDRTANRMASRMLVATFIHSDRDQKITLQSPQVSWGGRWKLNGQLLEINDTTRLPAEPGLIHTKLKKGWNVLMYRYHERGHSWGLLLNLWAEHPIRLAGGMTEQGDPNDTGWRVSGPFETGPLNPINFVDELKVVIQAKTIDPAATAERFEKIWESGRLTDEDLAAPFTRMVPSHLISPVNVASLCQSDTVQPKVKVKVENTQALLADSAEVCVIHPASDGSDVRLLLDFGDETVGYHELELDADAGTIVDNYNFEFIQQDGRYNLTEGMTNSFRYVCRQGRQRFRTFIRRGFRYSWLTFRNMKNPVKLRRVTLIQSTYPLADRGRFDSDDLLLNRIWQVGLQSLRCCAEDTYTDCPTYEQTHWVGDARNEALVDLVSSGDARLSAHCWMQVARSMERSVFAECQVPSGWEVLLPNWTFLWMRWAKEHYELTGDRAFAIDALKYLDQNFRGIKQFINADGLLDIHAWNLFDWAPMETPSWGVVTHQNCLMVLALKDTAALATMMGQKRLAKDWLALAESMSKAINRHLWCDKKKAFIDCIHHDGRRGEVLSQQTQTAAYIAGIPTGARAKRCRDLLENPPKGYVTAGSPFFMFFYLEVLASEGQYEKMARCISDYWGAQVKAGATTFWEMYHPNKPRMTRSHCHGWSAAPTYFLSAHILGIRPLEPGYRKLLWQPQPVAGMNTLHGLMPTPAGDARAYFRRTGKVDLYQLDLPDGIAKAQVILPRSGRMTVTQGKVRKIKPNVIEVTGSLRMTVEKA